MLTRKYKSKNAQRFYKLYAGSLAILHHSSRLILHRGEPSDVDKQRLRQFIAAVAQEQPGIDFVTVYNTT